MDLSKQAGTTRLLLVFFVSCYFLTHFLFASYLPNLLWMCMSVLSWLMFGLLVGILANAFDTNSRQSLTGNLLLGIGGAVIGGILASVVFGAGIQRFNMPSLVIAAVGSVLLLYAGRTIRRV